MKLKTVNRQLTIFLGLSLVIVFIGGCYTSIGKYKVTKEEILQAQKGWGNELVAVGKAYTDGGNYQKAAQELINNLYAYQTGEVLFKPTKASDIEFRTTKEGALSYFIGHNKKFPEDKGFALQPWTKVQFNNEAVYINDDVGAAMGKYFFIPQKGKDVGVEYTFGYVKSKDGKLKIFLHHSSLPYAGN